MEINISICIEKNVFQLNGKRMLSIPNLTGVKVEFFYDLIIQNNMQCW